MFLQFTVYSNPFPKDVLCSVWLKLAQWFKVEDINTHQFTYLSRLYFPLKKKHGPSFG